jgi:hypothetical protein
MLHGSVVLALGVVGGESKPLHESMFLLDEVLLVEALQHEKVPFALSSMAQPSRLPFRRWSSVPGTLSPVGLKM